MGNHSIDCDVCGNDLRGLSGGCAPGCPDNNAKFNGLPLHEKKALWQQIKAEREVEPGTDVEGEEHQILKWETYDPEYAFRADLPLFGSVRVERLGTRGWMINWSVPGYSSTLIEGERPDAEVAKSLANAHVKKVLEEFLSIK